MAEESEESHAGSGSVVEDTAPPPPTPPKTSYPSFSLNIWPPSQRTREAVTTRLVETLSSPSVLSKRYGTVPLDEASSAAREIEAAAFDAASSAECAASADASIDDGMEVLQIYSREISRRMLEYVKARSTFAAPATAPSDPACEEAPPLAEAKEEAPPLAEVKEEDTASSA